MSLFKIGMDTRAWNDSKNSKFLWNREFKRSLTTVYYENIESRTAAYRSDNSSHVRCATCNDPGATISLYESIPGNCSESTVKVIALSCCLHKITVFLIIPYSPNSKNDTYKNILGSNKARLEYHFQFALTSLRSLAHGALSNTHWKEWLIFGLYWDVKTVPVTCWEFNYKTGCMCIQTWVVAASLMAAIICSLGGQRLEG